MSSQLQQLTKVTDLVAKLRQSSSLPKNFPLREDAVKRRYKLLLEKRNEVFHKVLKGFPQVRRKIGVFKQVVLDPDCLKRSDELEEGFLNKETSLTSGQVGVAKAVVTAKVMAMEHSAQNAF